MDLPRVPAAPPAAVLGALTLVALGLGACAQPWPSERYSHVAALAPGGAALHIAGGAGLGGKRVDAWRLDLERGRWEQAPSPPEPIFRAVIGGPTGAPWVFGGTVLEDAESDRLYRWALDSGAWTLEDAGGGPAGRYKAAGAWDGERLWVHGGRADDDGAVTTWEDLWAWEDGAWSAAGEVGPGPITRQGLAWDAARGVLWCHGGLDGEGTRLDTLWRYTPGLGWEAIPSAGPAPAQRASHTVAVWEGRVLVWGGHPTDTAAWWFDPDTATWEEVPASEAPAPRDAHAWALDEDAGLLHLMGGDPFDEDPLPEFTADVWTLDLASGAWTPLGEGG